MKKILLSLIAGIILGIAAKIALINLGEYLYARRVVACFKIVFETQKPDRCIFEVQTMNTFESFATYKTEFGTDYIVNETNKILSGVNK